MSWTNDTELTTTYTNDTSTSLVSWDDIESAWDDSNVSWNGEGNPFQFDTELTTNYTNDTI